MRASTAWRESAKLLVRSVASKYGFAVGRDPFTSRVSRALGALGVTTVLDVGANEGQYASLLRASGYGGRLVSYEPVRDAYRRLSARAARDQGWTAINAGLGSEPGSATINVSANSYSSSLLSIAKAHTDVDPASAYVRRETITLRTVDDEIRRLGVDPATTLLKVDTQGYEAPTLAGAADALAGFAAVQLELSAVEVYHGQVLAPELTERLVGRGLEIWTLDPGISDATGRMLQYDCLFVRTGLLVN